MYVINSAGGVAGHPSEHQTFFLWSFSGQCSKSHDLIMDAMCDANRESQIMTGLKQCEPSQKTQCSDLALRFYGNLNTARQRFGRDSCDFVLLRFQIAIDLQFVIRRTGRVFPLHLWVSRFPLGHFSGSLRVPNYASCHVWFPQC